MGSPKNVSWLSVVALAAIVCVDAPKSLRADDGSLASEPYVVFVAQDEAYARCGPSDDHYRTDPLRYGQELEVYVETADGWLGVRPPDDSFCWVPADAVELIGNGDTAAVTEDRTVAWIGTHLGRARQFRWQVQLASGEQVSILGSGQRDGADGPRTWYRIVPPSGEFRWIHESQTAESAEQLVQAIRQKSSEGIEFLPTEKVAKNSSGNDAFAGRGESRLEPRRETEAPLAVQGEQEGNRSQGASVSQVAMPLVAASTPSSAAALAPVPQGDAPQLSEAPRTGDVTTPEPIGSGLNEEWRSSSADRQASESKHEHPVSDAASQRGLLASLEFIGRPRLTDINAGIRQIGSGLLEPASPNNSAPGEVAEAVDANWVAGAVRPATATAAGPADAVQRATHLQPITMAAATPGPLAQVQTASPSPATRYVSSSAIAAIVTEARAADVERLSLIFSRLMAASASSAEMAPVARAAHQISVSNPDSVIAGRARLLAERVEQYQRVAERRDGAAVIQGTGSPSIPVAQAASARGSVSVASAPLAHADTGAVMSQPMASPSEHSQSGVEELTATGFLVQVYSARKDSPPFAITDNGGQTLAYVTPSPGLNLRMHLNSEVRVQGTRSFLRGLNTPHIRVAQATRTLER